MAATAIPAPDGGDGFPLMPKDAQDGYAVYVDVGARSLTKTADLLNVPRGTVRSWAHRYAWLARAKSEDDESRRAGIGAAAALASAQHIRNIEAAMEIRDDPKAPASARIRAIEWLSGVGGLVPAQRTEISFEASDEIGGIEYSQTELDALARAGDYQSLLAIARGEKPRA
jgi:hypothetical protein